MRISNLILFCEVIEEGNISKVARKRFISQPAVTKQIRNLENVYQVKLFDRHRGHLFATKAGKQLYKIAKKIIHEYSQSFDVINEIKGAEYSNLTIGSSYTIGEYILPEILGEFKRKHTELNIKLEVSSTPSILNRLKKNQISFALVEGKVEDEELKIDKFAEDNLVLVCSPSHPLLNKQNVTLEDIASEKFIFREKGSGLRKLVEEILETCGEIEDLNIYMELGSNQAIKKAVEAGLGVTLLSDLIVKRELENGSLRKLSISNLYSQRDLWVVYRKDYYINETEQEFLHLIMTKK